MRGRRRFLKDNYLDIVYRRFFYEAVAVGRIPAPGFLFDPAIEAAYLGHEWTWDAAGLLDPLREMKATEGRLSLNLTSREQEKAESTAATGASRSARSAKSATC